MISLKKTLEAIKNSISSLSSTVTSHTSSISSLNTANTYSTSAKAVGTWIDGRTIYRKVYTCTIPTASGWNNIQYIGSINQCIRLWGIFTGSDGRIMHTNWCDQGSNGTTQYNCVLSINGNYIQCGRGTSGTWGGRTVYVILEYT